MSYSSGHANGCVPLPFFQTPWRAPRLVELVLEPSPLPSPYIHTCNPVEELAIKYGDGFELIAHSYYATLALIRPFVNGSTAIKRVHALLPYRLAEQLVISNSPQLFRPVLRLSNGFPSPHMNCPPNP